MSSIDKIKQEILNTSCADADELEAYRKRFISKKSVVGELFSQMRDVPVEERKVYGQKINELKNLAQNKFQELIKSRGKMWNKLQKFYHKNYDNKLQTALRLAYSEA